MSFIKKSLLVVAFCNFEKSDNRNWVTSIVMWSVTSIKLFRYFPTILNKQITYHIALPCPKVSVLFLILYVFTTDSAYDIGRDKSEAFDTLAQSLYSIFLRHSLKREIGSPKEESKQSSLCPVWRSINWRDAPKHGELAKKASTACLLASRAETGNFQYIELSIMKTNILLYTMPLNGVGIHKDFNERHFNNSLNDRNHWKWRKRYRLSNRLQKSRAPWGSIPISRRVYSVGQN